MTFPAVVGNRGRIVVNVTDGTLRMRRLRLRHRVPARLFSASLDRRLAMGQGADTGPLIAARAAWLVRPSERERLARDWEDLLRAASGPDRRRSACPLNRRRVLAAEPTVRELIRTLRCPLAPLAAGVALARTLLTDGTGPVYNRGSSVDLTDRVARAIREMALPSPGI